MDFGVEAFFDEGEDPVDDLVVQIYFDDVVLDAAFLQYGKAKSLGDVSIILLLENLNNLDIYLNNLVKNSHIAPSICDILYPS